MPQAGWGAQWKGEPSSPPAAKPSPKQENLSGFRSLKIDVQQAAAGDQQLLTFTSLGADPQIGITLARRSRTEALVWGIALAVFVLGVALTGRPARQKVALVLGLALASALLPLAYDMLSLARICDGVFYAASLLAPYYLVAGFARWIVCRVRGLAGRITGTAAAHVPAAMVVALVALCSVAAQAQSQSAAEREENLPPVAVPADAVIVPYDARSKTGVKDADHLLVSHDRYVELWNLAHPDKKIEAHPRPCPTPSRRNLYARCWRARKRLRSPGRCKSTSWPRAMSRFPSGSAAACSPGPKSTANRPN